jgi:hypothetical protein
VTGRHDNCRTSESNRYVLAASLVLKDPRALKAKLPVDLQLAHEADAFKKHSGALLDALRDRILCDAQSRHCSTRIKRKVKT